MRGEEVDYLKIEKKKIGKDFPIINEEIQNIKDFQLGIKNNKREIKSLNKELDKKESQIQKYQEQINKLKKENFNLQLKADQNSIQYIKTDTISNLKQIMIILKKGKSKSKDLQKKLKIDSEEANECLKFLEMYNLIKCKNKIYWRE